MDRTLHEIARLMLDQLGARYARIHDGGVEAKLPSGEIRIDVTRR